MRCAVRASGHVAVYAAALCVGLWVVACGSSGSAERQVVVRVGSQPITRAMVDHWATVLRGGPSARTPGSQGPAQVRRQALALLITQGWLLGAAADHRISISAEDVRQQINAVARRDFEGDRAELLRYVKTIGETTSDLERQAQAELAAEQLRELAVAYVPSVTQAQIADFYERHKQRFVIPERRFARFANRKTRAQVMQLKREVEEGKSLTSPERRAVGEVFTSARVPPTDAYEKAIDSAKPHAVAGPFKIGADEWLYEVVRIVPARQRALVQVASMIRSQLGRERRKAALDGFVKTWEAIWRAKTDCAPVYVALGCEQFAQSGHVGLSPEA